MNFKHTYLFVTVLLAIDAIAFNPALLTNNKELTSNELSRWGLSRANKWAKNVAGGDTVELKNRTKQILDSAVVEFSNRKAKCDLGLYQLLKDGAEKDGLIKSSSDLKNLFSYMRKKNVIDDILLSILLKSHEVADALSSNRKSYSKEEENQFSHKDNINLAEAYDGLQTWPDEINLCSLGRFAQLSSALEASGKKVDYRKISRHNKEALKKGLISSEIYLKLEILADQEVLSWNHYLRGYFEVVANAKDKLATSESAELPDASKESTKYLLRRSKLTQRGYIYKTYDSTQIVMLAGVIQKASRRLDASQVSIHFQFDEAPEDNEIYVLSPMERYRLAIKMIRKDMADLMKTQLFAGISIEYEDVVASAYETGLISAEELDHILKFEEFWNPTIPKWKKYARFTFSILGTASFYLPPPWNIVGALALVITETKLMNADAKPDSDDNWNSVI